MNTFVHLPLFSALVCTLQITMMMLRYFCLLLLNGWSINMIIQNSKQTDKEIATHHALSCCCFGHELFF